MLSNRGAREDSWTARRSIKSILKEINPEYSLEGLMLKLKLQHFGNLMQRADSLEKTLMLGKIKGRRSGQQRMRWLDGITDREGQGSLACCSQWGCKESNTTKRLNNMKVILQEGKAVLHSYMRINISERSRSLSVKSQIQVSEPTFHVHPWEDELGHSKSSGFEWTTVTVRIQKRGGFNTGWDQRQV